ncbi:MAG: 3-dehydroquinate synthase [Bacteroidales bacterium]|nr:3-dehydroquinate synthase [Bacteroidales bacterium]
MNLKDFIFTGSDGWQKLAYIVDQYPLKGVFILVDENTRDHCLPVVFEKCPALKSSDIITVQSGEENKTITSAVKVWQELSNLGALRNSLLICLGGGMVSDLGGFVAATYKRGMDYILMPTSLLGMVDAAIGGKTGLNLDGLKNQVGLISAPKGVFLMTEFLQTLPERHFKSGFAEMVKHALISDRSHYNELLQCNLLKDADADKLIYHSAAVKIGVVESDPHEMGRRKVLNLGHTVGHALESYSLMHDAQPLIHGEAVAAGLVCEAFISMRMLGLSESDLQSISNFVTWNFPHYRLKPSACNDIIAIMLKDKKIDNPGKINFSLIQSIGKPLVDQYPGEKLIRESMHFYVNIEFGFFS